MVYAVFQEYIEYVISLCLGCLAQGISAKDDPRTSMSSATKKLSGYHLSISLEDYPMPLQLCCLSNNSLPPSQPKASIALKTGLAGLAPSNC
jgi:hypothetical protein